MHGVKDLVGRIARLLDGEDVDKQLAAAVVVAELAIRDAGVVEALTRALASPVAVLQQRALLALARIAPRRRCPPCWR